MSGLGHGYWGEVIEVLRFVIPVYDKVNRAISLGKDMKFRLKGIHGRVHPGNLLLDAGSGYGNMSRIALNETNGTSKIIMYDPIPEMLAAAKHLFLPGPSEFTMSSGVFEYMPFRNNIFDAVLCGYSLRDAIQLRPAISEISRVLKLGGRLIIVDLGKPDNPVIEACVSFYLRHILKILAFAVAGKVGLKFQALYGTYCRWPKNSELNNLLKEYFSKVDFDTELLGGAVIVAAYK
ncbi:MAG: methyltransferase domain-containing protein [Nitrosopumilales archaeon]|nr:methyltransferase domain-containing protein [Nitrosopumilales archaeon]